MNLYPTVLTDSLPEAEQQITYVLDSGAVSTVQIDVIDGLFADNLTISPLDLTHIEYGDLKLDFHLQVEEPMDFVHEIVGIKEYLPIRAIIAQVERMSYQAEYVREVKRHGWKVGLSLDLFTPVSAIDDESWEHLDIVQLMTIEAGFQGEKFHPQALEKIKEIRAKVSRPIEIIVDGGVKEAQIPLLAKAGVDGVGIGSALWQTTDPQATIEQFAELLQTEDSDAN